MGRSIPAVGLVLALGAAVFATARAQPSSPGPQAWRGCCGVTPWPYAGGMMGGGMGPGMMGGGMMYGGTTGGSAARHRTGMMGGVPAPYASLANPLPRTSETIARGATVFAANCASCHGATGLGDGEAGRKLSPRPANLAWLSNMPMGRWDSFMYWTVAEGGAPFGTAMPSFKASLPKDDIWAVTAYIQAHLPPTKAK